MAARGLIDNYIHKTLEGMQHLTESKDISVKPWLCPCYIITLSIIMFSNARNYPTLKSKALHSERLYHISLMSQKPRKRQNGWNASDNAIISLQALALEFKSSHAHWLIVYSNMLEKCWMVWKFYIPYY